MFSIISIIFITQTAVKILYSLFLHMHYALLILVLERFREKQRRAIKQNKGPKHISERSSPASNKTNSS